MQNYLSLSVIVLGALNILSFALVGIDKKKSRAEGERRFPEAWFFFISVFFASLGVFLGIFVFKHKTKKFYFPVGIGLLLIEQTVLLLLLSKFFV